VTPEFRKPRSAADTATADESPVVPAPATEPLGDAHAHATAETETDPAADRTADPAADPATWVAPPQSPPEGEPHTPSAVPVAVRRSRFGALWISSILAAVVLVLLLVFIIQNSAKVDISFLGAHGHLPLGVALLLSAVSGLLLVAIPGTGRILQLRRQVRRGLATGAGATAESRRHHRSRAAD